MKYRELYDGYTNLLQNYSKMRFELEMLPTDGTESSRAGQLRKEITQIDARLEQLEQVAQILDVQMSRSFFFLRQCANMDALPLSKRPEALAFANAMTALRGLPVSDEVNRGLDAWAAGKLKYKEVYFPFLQRYHVLEDDYV